jgi:putative FmdB family regulatory protein
MPIYEYQAVKPERGCKLCAQRFEQRQAMSDTPLKRCPACGGRVERVISRCGISTQSPKSMLSDRNLKAKGFKKLVNEGGGKFRNVL